MLPTHRFADEPIKKNDLHAINSGSESSHLKK